MPQLIALAALGGALWAGYRLLKRETARARADLARAEDVLKRRREAEVASSGPASGGSTLVENPETGVYSPRN